MQEKLKEHMAKFQAANPQGGAGGDDFEAPEDDDNKTDL